MLRKIRFYSLLISIGFCFIQCHNNSTSQTENPIKENFEQKKQTLVGN